MELHTQHKYKEKKGTFPSTVSDQCNSNWSTSVQDNHYINTCMSCIPDLLIKNTENWRSLETDKRNLSSWENSICVTVRLWDCRRPTAFQDPTSHSHISAIVAVCACTMNIIRPINLWWVDMIFVKQGQGNNWSIEHGMTICTKATHCCELNWEILYIHVIKNYYQDSRYNRLAVRSVCIPNDWGKSPVTKNNFWCIMEE